MMTKLCKGDIINVLGTFLPLAQSSSSTTTSITISSKSNLLILHPDVLLTATALSNAPQCRRKPLLSSLVRSSSSMTPALVWGNMLHTVLESCLRTNQFDELWVNSQIETVVQSGVSDLVQINTTIEDAQKEVKLRAKGIHTFAKRYISDRPKVRLFLSWIYPSYSILAVARSNSLQYSCLAGQECTPCDNSAPRRRRRYLVSDIRTQRQS